ncbi:MAG: metalloregulator ArsR/SmtB family transcription factor, partial [Acidobacteriota bacterium]
MQESTLIELEKLFLALSDKTRLRLLSLMADGEVPVGFLADKLGESQPKISRHLAYLRTAGLVSTRRDGKWIYYGIEEQDDAGVTNVLNAALGSILGNRVVQSSRPQIVSEFDEYVYQDAQTET